MGTREEWEIEQEKRKMLQDQMVTEFKKTKFIEDILGGLGEVIKEEPNKIPEKPIKLTWYQKLSKLFGR